MSKFIIEEQITGLGQRYWEGRENKIIRWWVYIQRGVDVFNKFKYYIGFPFAAYYTFKFMAGKPWWIVAMILGGLPILAIVGRYDIQKVSKTTQYVQTISGDIFQFEPIKLQILLVKFIRAIASKLGINTQEIEQS